MDKMKKRNVAPIRERIAEARHKEIICGLCTFVGISMIIGGIALYFFKVGGNFIERPYGNAGMLLYTVLILGVLLNLYGFLEELETKVTKRGVEEVTERVKEKMARETTGFGIASLILGILGIVIGIIPMQYTPETLLGGGVVMLLFGSLATGLGASVRKKDSLGVAGMILGIITIALSILVILGAMTLLAK